MMEDAVYARQSVEKLNSKTAKVILNSIEFEDIITKIEVYVTIEVV